MNTKTRNHRASSLGKMDCYLVRRSGEQGGVAWGLAAPILSPPTDFHYSFTLQDFKIELGGGPQRAEGTPRAKKNGTGGGPRVPLH